MTGLEAAGAATSLAAVWLTTRQNAWCWPVGLVSVLLYAVVFREARLYADMGLQGVYAVLCLYGWWAWLRGAQGRPLPVARTPRRVLLGSLALGALFAVALGAFLRHRTDASLPFWDAGTTSGSLVAQFLQTRKWIENWPLWIAVDVVYVGIYLAKDLRLTAALYALFLALAVSGLVSWRRSLPA